MSIHVNIVSAEAQIYAGDVEMIVANGEMGELGIVQRHAPLITRLKPGQIRVVMKDGSEQNFYVSGGILEVQPSGVTVLSDTALRAKDIDEAKVRAAKEEAERLISSRDKDMDIAAAQSKLAEASAQLAAIERLRKNLKH